jgi:hypothetical protein
MGDRHADAGLQERQRVAITSRAEHQDVRRSGTQVGEETAGVPLRRCWPSSGSEGFLYTLKAGPAGGRLRRHDGHRGTGLTLHTRSHAG